VRLYLPIAALLLGCAYARGHAQVPIPMTQRQHVERVQSLEQIVQRCVAEATGCSPERVGADETVHLDHGATTEVSYGWLRRQLDGMTKQKAEERAAQGQMILKRLGWNEESVAPQRDARREANDVLRQVEFADAKPTWWDRLTRRAGMWWARHFAFDGASQSAKISARIVLEVLLFGTPLVLLALWLLRQIREERIVPEVVRGSSKGGAPSISWGDEARACAERGAWRDAVHALYWQTIARFEERRVWAATRTRTPREYVALLEPGSERSRLLREQTVLLETIWYGHREANEGDYRRADDLAKELGRA
jgi:uncharacterized protein DUF4129